LELKIRNRYLQIMTLKELYR